jgi:hypothetical protein
MELFLEACGARGPLQLDVTYPGEGTTRRVFHQPFLRIGFDRRNDFRLPHRSSIYHGHVYLQVIAGRVFFVDIRDEPRGGGRTRDRLAGWLQPEQALRVGGYSIQLAQDSDGDAAAPPLDPVDGQDPLLPAPEGLGQFPEATVELLNGTGPREPRPLSRVLTLVGRSPYCGLRLVGASVSDFQCALLRTPLGVWVLDLIGRGGIRVNETGLVHARLEDGDRLLLGRFCYQLRYQAAGALSADTEGLTSSAPTLLEQETQLRRDGEAAAPAGLPAPHAAGFESRMPLEALRPPPGAGTDWLPAPLAALVGQLGQMQQQMMDWFDESAGRQQDMFDRFHHAMFALVKMMDAQRRSEMEGVREELDRLRELTRELNQLQSAVKKSLQPGPKPSPAKATEPRADETSAAGAWAPGAARRLEELPDTPGVEVYLAAPVPEAAPSGGGDSYDWLCQRIQVVQHERQNLWQKVLDRVLGAGQ